MLDPAEIVNTLTTVRVSDKDFFHSFGSLDALAFPAY